MTTPTPTPVPGATPTYDDDGNELVHVATCGACGRSWNDAAVSGTTPVPSGRCPFEYDHDDTNSPETPPNEPERKTYTLELTGAELVSLAGYVRREEPFNVARRGLATKVKALRDDYFDEVDPDGTLYRRRRTELEREA